MTKGINETSLKFGSSQRGDFEHHQVFLYIVNVLHNVHYENFLYCDSFDFYVSSLKYTYFMQGKKNMNYLRLTSLVCPIAMMKSK